MSDWQTELDVRDVWGKAQEGDISNGELAGIVADRLEALVLTAACLAQEDVPIIRDDLVLQFRELKEQEEEGEEVTNEEFNALWAELYDWADQHLDSHFAGKAVCWVRIH